MSVEGQRCNVTWSGLLEELLNQVLTKLGISDYLNFRQVCTTWREAAKQLKECLFSPLFMMPYYEDDQLCCCFFQCPFNGKWYKTNRLEFDKNYKCRGSFHGWLLMFNEDSGTIFLINPFTGVRVNLPRWDKSQVISEFALSSAPTDPNCVIIILDRWSFKFCRVGDNKWIKEESKFAMSNALVIRGKIYVLGYSKPSSCASSIAALHTTTLPKLDFLFLPNLRDYGWTDYYGPYLVESNGEILLVVKQMKVSYISEKKIRKYDFLVFKLDLSTSSWVEMKKIGNRVLVIGLNCSVSFATTESDYGENQIYFVDYDIDIGWGVFNMEDGSRKKGSSLSSSPFLNGVCIDDPLLFWITPSFI